MTDEATATLQLKKMEKAALHGVMLRERELMREGQTLQTDIQEIFGEIEERLGLERGAINRTHRVNLDDGMVQPLPSAQPTPPLPELTVVKPERGAVEADLSAVVAERIANGAVPAE